MCNIMWKGMILSYAVCLCNISLSSSSSTTTTTTLAAAPRINLSYQPHIDQKKITAMFRRKFKSIISSSSSSSLIEIDVSASHLGDQGMESLLKALIDEQIKDEDCEDGTKVQSSISLEARMNKISAIGASNFFELLINATSINVGDGSDIDAAKGNVTVSIINGTTEEGTNEINIKGTDEITTSSTISTSPKCAEKDMIYLEKVDIGLNDIGSSGHDGNPSRSKKNASQLHKSLRKVIENESGSSCPRVLRLDSCGFGAPSCRAIGKGLINRYNHLDRHHKGNIKSLRELYLSGNEGIGDGGAAALAAALKMASIPNSTSSNQISTKMDGETNAVLDMLDLSSCSIGDAGVGALAMAIENNPGCLARLDLSNNVITDDGVIALSKGLIAGQKNARKARNTHIIDSIDLSNNIDIGDEGIEALMEAVECGAIRSLSLRSCSIRWRGAAAVGAALGNVISTNYHGRAATINKLEIDISGNKLGTKQVKKKQSYSANVMNGMASGMNFIGKRLKTGLKDVGLSSIVGSSLESDDEAELEDTLGSELGGGDNDKTSISRCGACALYDDFCEILESMKRKKNSKDSSAEINILLGMRMCNLDDQGINALAATCVLAGEQDKVKLSIDSTMNRGLDEEVIEALLVRGHHQDHILEDTAERHFNAMKAEDEIKARRNTESHMNDYYNMDEDASDINYDSYDNDDLFNF